MQKNKQSGAISAGLAIALGFIALMFVGIAMAAMVAISAYNQGNEFETALSGTYKNNQNLLASYSQTVVEAAQVPAMQRDDIIAITKEAIGGRYGPDGSRAVFQAISERNPQMSEKLYINIQQIVQAGRSKFEVGQTRLIDQTAAYRKALGTFPRGFIMGALGYPKVDLEKYNPIITQSVENTYKTGKEASPIQLRPAPAPAQ